ncbi:MAG TPA: SUF system NifU family Fe-S cluster assembly protein [Bacilli bacterium]|nr:SUF system NifU family Fe-S cluster assembly protein [Bacilli bacterium]
MDNNIRRDIIIDNYENPFNKGLIDDKNYKKTNMNNESCIDNLDFIIKLENNIIKDIRFDGQACAISTSASSIMIKTLINKTKEEALEIITNYENMIDEKPYNKDLLNELNVYDEIYKQPNRKKCALLPFWGIKKLLK